MDRRESFATAGIQNDDSSVFQPIANPLHRLSYPGFMMFEVQILKLIFSVIWYMLLIVPEGNVGSAIIELLGCSQKHRHVVSYHFTLGSTI